eukprot:6649964-Pyramimonas_sp.AAC.1
MPEEWLREVVNIVGGRRPARRITAEDRGGLRDYSTILHPGEYLSAAVAAGGAVSITACGECGHLCTSTP